MDEPDDDDMMLEFLDPVVCRVKAVQSLANDLETHINPDARRLLLSAADLLLSLIMRETAAGTLSS